MAKAKAAAPISIGLVASDQGLPENTQFVWRPNSDKQRMALLRPEFEIFYGGAKGGGKSYCGIGWLINGNPQVPLDKATPTDLSYIENPLYRGIALRKNHIDLGDWIDKARTVYLQLGAEFTEGEFRFKSGAKIVTGHLGDESSYEKYFGRELHRIFIDELTFIESKKLYLRVLSCCRSTVAGIRPQILSTGNPGGPGTRWVKDRFITPRIKGGAIAEPMTPLAETYWNPVLKKNVQITRIFIPSKAIDNPDLMREDPLYITRLEMQPEAERRAYLDGDWDALSGQFFSEYRPRGPIGSEVSNFPAARHVIPSTSTELLPYWHRWIGMDWGYSHDSAVFWACQHPDHRVYVYREAVMSKVGAEEWGALLARESGPDLAGLPDHHLTLFLSPDAFARRDEANTIAEQIGNGISRILGRNSVFLVDFTEEERALPADQAWASLNRRSSTKSQFGITIQRASNERVSGWMQVREFLRWKPIYKVSNTRIDWDVFEKIRSENGIMSAAEYLQQIAAQKDEILPKLQIFDCCPKLIRAISEAQHDEARPEDVMKNDYDNEVDALRYLLMAHSSREVKKPREAVVSEAIEALGAGASGHSRYMVATHVEAQYNKTVGTSKSFNLPRRVGRHRRAGAW